MIEIKKIIKQILINSLTKSSRLGTYQFFILIALIFLSLNYILEFKILILGLFLIYLIIVPIRLLFFKNRPKLRKYTNIIEKIDASSMPSSHGARSIFLFLFLINFFTYNIKFIILLFCVFLAINYARIYKKQHYKIDIFVGIIIGIISWYLSNLFL